MAIMRSQLKNIRGWLTSLNLSGTKPGEPCTRPLSCTTPWQLRQHILLVYSTFYLTQSFTISSRSCYSVRHVIPSSALSAPEEHTSPVRAAGWLAAGLTAAQTAPAITTITITVVLQLTIQSSPFPSPSNECQRFWSTKLMSALPRWVFTAKNVVAVHTFTYFCTLIFTHLFKF